MFMQRRFEDETDPHKGPKGDTAFLKDNYRMMSVGSSFRTVKARFSLKQIQAGAKKAGFVVEIKNETPWWCIRVIGKAAIKPAAKKRPTACSSAGKVRPE